jgi:hypothetical protein
MKEIKGAADFEALRQAGVRDGVLEVVAKTLSDLLDAYDALDAEWDPDVEGYIVLLEPGDDIENMPEVGLHPHYRGLVGIPKEYAERYGEQRVTLVVCVPGNSWAWSYLLPWEVTIPQELAYELADLDHAAKARASEG